MRKVQSKTLVARPTKEVSVTARIEDAGQNVLMVRQAAGLKLWTLPGGKRTQILGNESNLESSLGC
jgi:ADP-ribose pyrophosphatase YjhB (NUDIX family)